VCFNREILRHPIGPIKACYEGEPKPKEDHPPIKGEKEKRGCKEKPNEKRRPNTGGLTGQKLEKRLKPSPSIEGNPFGSITRKRGAKTWEGKKG